MREGAPHWAALFTGLTSFDQVTTSQYYGFTHRSTSKFPVIHGDDDQIVPLEAGWVLERDLRPWLFTSCGD
jgi:hypothetical protein